MIERAQKICRYIEKRLRPAGWHVALTGSTLYGNLESNAPPADIDLIFYPNNDKEKHCEGIEDLFATAGIKKYKQLSRDDYDRTVYETYLKTGEKVNVWMLLDYTEAF